MVECTSCITSASYPTRQGHYRIITFHTYRATTMMGGRLASTERRVERESCRPRSGTRDLFALELSKAANSHSRGLPAVTRLPRTIVRHAHVCTSRTCATHTETRARWIARRNRTGGSRVNYRLDRILRCFVVFQRAERK